MTSGGSSVQTRPDNHSSSMYVAAAVYIALGIAMTAAAVWHLDASDPDGRLAATPWACCLAE
jgi:hypothetical protein